VSRVEGVRAAAVAAGTVGFLFSILFSIFRFLFSVSCFLVLGFWFQVAGCTRVAAEPVVVAAGTIGFLFSATRKQKTGNRKQKSFLVSGLGAHVWRRSQL